MTTGIRQVSNPSSALGEAVGKLFESAVIECLREEVEARGYAIRPERLTNGTGNTYQIDAVIFDSDGNPVVIIEPKYIRYTKHNRDKGSWLCTAHYNLRKTFPTIRKSIAVLGGRWSNPSQALMRSFGVQLLAVPFSKFVSVLEKSGVDFDWPERGAGEQPRRAWEAFSVLDEATLEQIGEELVAEICEDLTAAVVSVLDTDVTSLPRRISGIEVLLKTDQGEMVLRSFESVSDALIALTTYVVDRQDIGDLPP